MNTGPVHPVSSFHFAAFLALFRPVNTLLTGLAVLLGIYLGTVQTSALVMICGPLSAMLIAAGGYIDNDIADLPADAVNRPARPLPSRLVPINTAMLGSLACFAAGLIVAGICSPAALSAAGGAAIVLVAYNHYAKRLPLVGNLAIGVLGGFPLVYAGLLDTEATGGWLLLWIAFGLACLLHLVRELLKDIEDIEGDRAAEFRTAAVQWGTGVARLIAGIVAVVTGVVVVLPGILRWLNERFLVGVVLVVSLPCFILGFRLFRKMSIHEISRWSTYLKIIMVLGMILLLAGKL